LTNAVKGHLQSRAQHDLYQTMIIAIAQIMANRSSVWDYPNGCMPHHPADNNRYICKKHPHYHWAHKNHAQTWEGSTSISPRLHLWYGLPNDHK